MWIRANIRHQCLQPPDVNAGERHNIRNILQLNIPVTAREWDDEQHLWRLTVAGRPLTARFVISAIGAFVEPKPPVIAGLDTFAGTTLSSTSWDHTVELAGKRVAIIGTGASAVQIVPEIAAQVARLDVYQRTPIWVAPKVDPPIPAIVARLFRSVATR